MWEAYILVGNSFFHGHVDLPIFSIAIANDSELDVIVGVWIHSIIQNGPAILGFCVQTNWLNIRYNVVVFKVSLKAFLDVGT